MFKEQNAAKDHSRLADDAEKKIHPCKIRFDKAKIYQQIVALPLIIYPHTICRNVFFLEPEKEVLH